MKVNDYGDKLMEVLGSISELTGHGDLKAMLPLIQPLKSGFEGLFGLGDQQVHLGIHDTFAYGHSSPNPLIPGYRVVMDITDHTLDPNTLWVKDGRLHSGPTLGAARPFEGADYLLFNVEKVKTRGADLPSVNEAWIDAMERVARSSDQEVDLSVNAYKAIVLTSPDLIWNDQRGLILTLLERIKQIRTNRDLPTLGVAPTEMDLNTAMAIQKRHPVVGIRPVSREELSFMDWR